jgi:hypothetical protein
MGLSSCYTNFDPSDNEKPVLCLNAMITADEPMTVYVNRTHRYTEGSNYFTTDDYYVKDATVKLYIDDKYVEDLVYAEWTGYNSYGGQITLGGYKSKYAPKQGERVRIVATSPEYGEAIGEETMPIAVPIDKVEVEPTMTDATIVRYIDDEYTFHVVEFDTHATLTFTDPANATNYYTADVEPELPAELDEDADRHIDEDGKEYSNPMVYFRTMSLDYDAEPLFAEHISVLEALMGGDSYGCNYFSDNQISGKSYTVNLRYDKTQYFKRKFYNKDLAYHMTMNVMLGSVSQSYYYWQLYNWKRENSMQGQLSDIGMSEQLVSYSNVSTGAGVICTRSYSVVKVDIADFLREAVAGIEG